MKVPRLATQSLNRWLERTRRLGTASLVACAIAILTALAGCQSQQTNPGDPFLPFMRTRVPPPGTNVPADSYYQGAPATTAPPAVAPPPAGAPMTAPSSMRSTAPGDKYSPPGGYNLPQSSINRAKVSDPATGEVKAGGTAIARRSFAKPANGQSTVDTELTAGKVTGAAGVADASGIDGTTSAEALAATTPSNRTTDKDAADASATSSTETPDTPTRDGAALAFADTAEGVNGQANTDDAQHGHADRRMPLASAGGWSSGSAPEETLVAHTSTLRIVAADDRDSSTEDSDLTTPDDHQVAMRIAANDRAGSNEAAESGGEAYAPNGSQSEPGSDRAQASLIGTTEPAEQTAALAMAESASPVIQATWNETATATTQPAAGGTSRASGPAARANQAYAYDPSYGWLRGRLEYSASQRQWKLRYIPIDGATDQFGGSVVLADGAATQGLRAGDFVTAQGRVVGASQTGRGFSPRYDVASIEPIAGSH